MSADVLADAPWPPCENGCHRPDCDHGQALAESFWDTCPECGQDRCVCDLRQGRAVCVRVVGQVKQTVMRWVEAR